MMFRYPRRCIGILQWPIIKQPLANMLLWQPVHDLSNRDEFSAVTTILVDGRIQHKHCTDKPAD